jgi:hypothetical protein
MQATRNRLDAQRWHWQHGPIDIVAQADGEPAALAAAHEAAWARFQGVLAELVAELPLLRQPVRADAPAAALPRGPIARRMWAACAPFAPAFITPMAAVAGSVAQELIACYQRAGVRRAWLNNGGDIALHLAPGECLRTGVVSDPGACVFGPARRGHFSGGFVISAAMPVRGVATSGWPGRSLSLGIADSVTVLAASAAQADAAATVIANAVDAEHPAIVRRRACEVRDDSDLGQRLVTVDVPALPPALVRSALQRGARQARDLQARGLIWAAHLVCQNDTQVIEPVAAAESPVPALAA